MVIVRMRKSATMSNKKLSKKTFLVFFCIFAALLLAVELFNIIYSVDKQEYELVYGTLSRALGAAICILLIKYCNFDYLFSFKALNVKALLLILPCFLVSVNNFPFIPVLNDGIAFEAKWYFVLLYAIQCLFVGLFEETAFRGCVFMLMLEKRHKTRRDIFFSIILSSLVFGAIHIVNIFAGAGIVPVILQLGYSFLIGAMCAVALLITRSIWVPVILHALFNFAGGVIPTFVSNFKIWTKGEIVLTVIVSVIVAAYVVFLFFKYELSKLQRIIKE